MDLTRSVAVVGPDGKSEFQKNIDGVTRLLAHVPAGARVTVIGITDRSFAQPYILLSATLSHDPGYFGERIAAARSRLITDWKHKSAALRPNFPTTDILGALMLSGQMFAEDAGSDRKVLILFSDMRNSTTAFELERTGDLSAALAAVGSPAILRPDLRGIDVFALGVDGAGQSLAYWRDLGVFWQRYFASAGTSLRCFSTLRSASNVSAQSDSPVKTEK